MSPATLQLILQGGAFGVLLLVLVGLYLLVRLGAPAAKEFLLGLVADQKANTTALVALAEQQRAGFAALTARLDLAEQRIGAVVDRAAKDTIEVVRERASHVADEVTDEMRRSASGETPAHGLRAVARGR